MYLSLDGGDGGRLRMGSGDNSEGYKEVEEIERFVVVGRLSLSSSPLYGFGEIEGDKKI